MEIEQRIKRYRAIEDYRGRPIIAYATNTRVSPLQIGMMAGDAVREFIDQLDRIKEGDSIDVLLHSTGGDALAAWKLMSILRERFDNVAVLVPYMAFSAATVFALGADDIVMHPHASLGPIDPQIKMTLPDGTQRSFSFEDLGAFLRFLAEEVQITEQEFLSPISEKLFSVVDPLNVGAAKRASELSTQVGERLLGMHMTGVEGRATARRIAEDLNKSFFSHGDAVTRTRARELQLQIADDDEQLESLMWQAYLGIEGYMDLRKQYNPLHVVLADQNAAAALRPPPPLNLPANTPPNVAQQAWQAAIQNALNAATGAGVEVPYAVVGAIIESLRAASEFRSEGTFCAVRSPTGEVQVSGAERRGGWSPVTIVTQTAETDGTAPPAEAAESQATESQAAS